MQWRHSKNNRPNWPVILLQTEYDSMYDYITQGAIIRSLATWYEFGERNNKYVLNLENSNKKKSTVPKVFNREGKLTTIGVRAIFWQGGGGAGGEPFA